MMTALLLASALSVSGAGAPRSALDAAPAARVLVVPFETAEGDGRTYWLGEAVSILIADDLASRGVQAITRSARAQAYEALHLPANSVLTKATVIKVGELVGARQIVVGAVALDGDVLTIKARPIRIDVGRARPEVVERGNLTDLFALAQTVARKAIPGGTPGPARLPTSPQVFERFVKGLLAEKPAAQAEFLEAAIRLDPHFDRARLALWDVRNAQGDNDAALEAVRAIPATSPDAPRAAFRAAVSLMALKQYDQAFAALKPLAETTPDAAVFNNLGVVQLHRPSQADAGKPAYFFTKAADADPDDPDVLFNLGYAYALDRDTQGATYWLREALRRQPVDGDAHAVLASVLEMSGNGVEAARERELAGQLASKYSDPARRPDAREVPKGLERVRQDLESRRASGLDQAGAAAAQRDQRDVAQFHLDRARRLFAAEQDGEAMTELRRAVFLSPYDAQAHLLIGRIHLRAGRPREAVDALKISIWSQDSVAARLALADAYVRLHQPGEALAEAQKAAALDPSNSEAAALVARLKGGMAT